MTLRIFACIGLLAAAAIAQSTGTDRRALRDSDSREIKLGEDEPGCKDSALLPRFHGCSIIQCAAKVSDTLSVQIGASAEAGAQQESLDGDSEVIYYLCPSKTVLGNIVRGADTALTKSGFKIVFNGKDDDDQPVVTGLKETQWVQLSTYMYNEYSAYILSTINVPVEAQVSSSALAEEIGKSGRVTLNSLAFEKEAFTMPSGAETVLAEVAAILVRQPEWRIRVEVHTGECPDKPSNVTLSQKRASAVAAWLLDHGIDPSRVAIQGIGIPGTGQRVDLVRF